MIKNMFSPIYRALLISFLCVISAYAEPLVQRNEHQLNQQHINQMILAGEKIALQTFSDDEKKALQIWAIDVYNKEKDIEGVVRAFAKYGRYLKLAKQYETRPDLQGLIWHHLYREMVFKWRFPRFQKNQQTLLDIIQRYNPVIKRRQSEKMLLARKDVLLAEKGDYFLSEPMWLSVRTMAEFLGKKPLSAKQQKGLLGWAKQDFKALPIQATLAYSRFLDEGIPQFFSPNSEYEQEKYRETKLREYYFLFLKDALARRSTADLMDVVENLNPNLVVDEKNKQLITQSELDTKLQTAAYFSEQFNLGLNITPEYKQSERQQLIANFMQRKPLSHSGSSSAYFLRSQSYWQQLPDEKKKALREQVKQQAQKKMPFWQALNPLFESLNVKIHAENQQTLLEQKLLMQQLRLNQKLHNSVMNTYKNSGKAISRSISDLSTTQSIQITGGKVLEKHKDYFVVEGKRGERYNISR